MAGAEMLREAETTAADEKRLHHETVAALQNRLLVFEGEGSSLAASLDDMTTQRDALRVDCDAKAQEIKALKDLLRETQDDLTEQVVFSPPLLAIRRP